MYIPRAKEGSSDGPEVPSTACQWGQVCRSLNLMSVRLVDFGTQWNSNTKEDWKGQCLAVL
jgi:hypothetical protein